MKSIFCKILETEEVQFLVRTEYSQEKEGYSDLIIEFEADEMRIKTTFGTVPTERTEEYLNNLTVKDAEVFLNAHKKAFG